MKRFKGVSFVALTLLAVTLLFPISLTQAAPQKDESNGRKLVLRAYFERYAGPQTLNFGDQFVLAGSLASFDKPNEKIGTFGLHFVVTGPFGSEQTLSGVLDLPDGQSSVTGMSTPSHPRVPGPITGGTGAYKDARGQLERRRMAHVERRGIIHLGDLARDRFRDLLAAMAAIHAPEARRGVEHLAALDGGVVHAFRLHEQARLRLERAVRGEGHEEGFEIVRGRLELRRFEGLRSRGLRRHVWDSRSGFGWAGTLSRSRKSTS